MSKLNLETRNVNDLNLKSRLTDDSASNQVATNIVRRVLEASGQGCSNLAISEIRSKALSKPPDIWHSRSTKKNPFSFCALELKRKENTEVLVEVSFKQRSTAPSIIKFFHAAAKDRSRLPLTCERLSIDKCSELRHYFLLGTSQPVQRILYIELQGALSSDNNGVHDVTCLKVTSSTGVCSLETEKRFYSILPMPSLRTGDQVTSPVPRYSTSSPKEYKSFVSDRTIAVDDDRKQTTKAASSGKVLQDGTNAMTVHVGYAAQYNQKSLASSKNRYSSNISQWKASEVNENMSEQISMSETLHSSNDNIIPMNQCKLSTDDTPTTHDKKYFNAESDGGLATLDPEKMYSPFTVENDDFNHSLCHAMEDRLTGSEEDISDDFILFDSKSYDNISQDPLGSSQSFRSNLKGSASYTLQPTASLGRVTRSQSRYADVQPEEDEDESEQEDISAARPQQQSLDDTLKKLSHVSQNVAALIQSMRVHDLPAKEDLPLSTSSQSMLNSSWRKSTSESQNDGRGILTAVPVTKEPQARVYQGSRPPRARPVDGQNCSTSSVVGVIRASVASSNGTSSPSYCENEPCNRLPPTFAYDLGLSQEDQPPLYMSVSSQKVWQAIRRASAETRDSSLHGSASLNTLALNQSSSSPLKDISNIGKEVLQGSQAQLAKPYPGAETCPPGLAKVNSNDLASFSDQLSQPAAPIYQGEIKQQAIIDMHAQSWQQSGASHLEGAVRAGPKRVDFASSHSYSSLKEAREALKISKARGEVVSSHYSTQVSTVYNLSCEARHKDVAADSAAVGGDLYGQIKHNSVKERHLMEYLRQLHTSAAAAAIATNETDEQQDRSGESERQLLGSGGDDQPSSCQKAIDKGLLPGFSPLRAGRGHLLARRATYGDEGTGLDKSPTVPLCSPTQHTLEPPLAAALSSPVQNTYSPVQAQQLLDPSEKATPDKPESLVPSVFSPLHAAKHNLSGRRATCGGSRFREADVTPIKSGVAQHRRTEIDGAVFDGTATCALSFTSPNHQSTPPKDTGKAVGHAPGAARAEAMEDKRADEKGFSPLHAARRNLSQRRATCGGSNEADAEVTPAKPAAPLHRRNHTLGAVLERALAAEEHNTATKGLAPPVDPVSTAVYSNRYSEGGNKTTPDKCAAFSPLLAAKRNFSARHISAEEPSVPDVDRTLAKPAAHDPRQMQREGFSPLHAAKVMFGARRATCGGAEDGEVEVTPEKSKIKSHRRTYTLGGHCDMPADDLALQAKPQPESAACSPFTSAKPPRQPVASASPSPARPVLLKENMDLVLPQVESLKDPLSGHSQKSSGQRKDKSWGRSRQSTDDANFRYDQGLSDSLCFSPPDHSNNPTHFPSRSTQLNIGIPFNLSPASSSSSLSPVGTLLAFESPPELSPGREGSVEPVSIEGPSVSLKQIPSDDLSASIVSTAGTDPVELRLKTCDGQSEPKRVSLEQGVSISVAIDDDGRALQEEGTMKLLSGEGAAAPVFQSPEGMTKGPVPMDRTVFVLSRSTALGVKFGHLSKLSMLKRTKKAFMRRKAKDSLPYKKTVARTLRHVALPLITPLRHINEQCAVFRLLQQARCNEKVQAVRLEGAPSAGKTGPGCTPSRMSSFVGPLAYGLREMYQQQLLRRLRASSCGDFQPPPE